MLGECGVLCVGSVVCCGRAAVYCFAPYMCVYVSVWSWVCVCVCIYTVHVEVQIAKFVVVSCFSFLLTFDGFAMFYKSLSVWPKVLKARLDSLL